MSVVKEVPNHYKPFGRSCTSTLACRYSRGKSEEVRLAEGRREGEFTVNCLKGSSGGTDSHRPYDGCNLTMGI